MSNEKVPLKQALRLAIAEMSNPIKDSTAEIPTRNGGKFRYSYATLDQVLSIVKTALAKHGLGLRQMVTETKWYNSDSDLSGIDYQLLTIVFDDDTELVVDQRPYRVIADAQQQGSYETYMRRYSLMMVFGLAGEDDDGASASKSESETTQPKAAERPTSFEGFTSLKVRLAACTGASNEEAAAALIAKIGDPRQMTKTQYQAALAQGESWVGSLERGENE